MKKLFQVLLATFVVAIFSTSAFAAPQAPNATSPFMFTPTNFKGGIPFVYTLAPGSKMTNSMRITNSSAEKLDLSLTVTMPKANPLEWLTIETKDITVEAESYKDVTFNINVPDSAKIGTTYTAMVSLAPEAKGKDNSGATTENTDVQVGVATAYATTFKVNVGTGEPMTIDNTTASTWSNLTPWIKDNINTIILVLILILTIKVAFGRNSKSKK